MAKGLSTTRGLDKLLAVICLSIIGYEFIIGGLPKVVLFIAFMGLVAFLIAILNSFKR